MKALAVILSACCLAALSTQPAEAKKNRGCDGRTGNVFNASRGFNGFNRGSNRGFNRFNRGSNRGFNRFDNGFNNCDRPLARKRWNRAFGWNNGQGACNGRGLKVGQRRNFGARPGNGFGRRSLARTVFNDFCR